MSGRTMKVKLAAAAVAVAGVLAGLVGTVWATPNTISTVDSEPVSIDFEFKFEGDLEFVPHDASVKTYSSIEVVAPPTAATVKDPGNLGHLKAYTNGPSWDIEFTTKYGGRLYSAGSYLSHVCNTNAFTGIETCDTTWETGEYLKYSGNTMPGNEADSSRIAGTPVDTVRLDMAIGLAAPFASGSPSFGSIYPLGAQLTTPSYVPPTRIGPTALEASGGVGTGTYTPVSFAERFAEDATTGTSGAPTANSALAALSGFAGLGTLATTVSTAATTGNLGTAGFRAVSDAQYFYINIGVHPDNTAEIVGIPDRKFSETITFNLKAGF